MGTIQPQVFSPAGERFAFWALTSRFLRRIVSRRYYDCHC
jgi:hypothetical protein